MDPSKQESERIRVCPWFCLGRHQLLHLNSRGLLDNIICDPPCDRAIFSAVAGHEYILGPLNSAHFGLGIRQSGIRSDNTKRTFRRCLKADHFVEQILQSQLGDIISFQGSLHKRSIHITLVKNELRLFLIPKKRKAEPFAGGF